MGINFETRMNDATGSLEHIAKIVEIGDLCNFTALNEDADAQGAKLDTNRITLDHPFPANEVPLLLKKL